MINVGKIVNTHGIKGEVRILSFFSDKSIFGVGNTIYVDGNPLKITTYRVHKNYDMVTFEGINDINDVLKYKGLDVFADINLDVPEIIIGYDVYTDTYKGKVEKLLKNPKHFIISLDNGTMIPYVDAFIKKVDHEKKIIYVNEIEGLFNEN